jgi:addiction module HigA family antidote
MKEHSVKYPTPGDILKREFLEPLKMTPYALAKSIGVQQIHLSKILKGKCAISVEMAFRFSRFFGTSAKFWLNLQQGYDLQIAEKTIAKKIEKAIKPLDLQAA